MPKSQKLYFALLTVLLTVGYTNCGLPFRSDSELASVGVSRSACETDLQATYKSTYLPLITQNCASCHNDAGVAPLKLASSDQSLAFNAFMQATESLVQANAVNPSHAAGRTGPQLQTVVSAAHATFQPAFDDYNKCLAGGNGGGGGSTDQFDLPEQNFANLYFQDNQVVTASWDTSTQGSPIANRFPGIFKMDIQVKYGMVDGVNQPVGYTFTKPRIQMLTGESEIEVEGIVVRVNGAKVAGMEPFLSARNTARRIDPVEIYSGSVVGSLPTIMSSDRISVSFGFMQLRPRTDALVIPPNPSLSMPNSFSRTATLTISIGADSTARRWCLTTVNRKPNSTAEACPGYEGSALGNGWLSVRPSMYNLSDLGPLPADGVPTSLFLWVANSDLKINPGVIAASFQIDTVKPNTPVISASMSDTQVADLNIPDVNEPITGWCVKESNLTNGITTNYTCTNFSTTKPTLLPLSGGGVRYIRATIRDRAGNTTDTNTVTVNNTFGQIDFKQLTGASGTRAVITNNCVSCHGAGKSGEAAWKAYPLSDGQAATDASWLDTRAKSAQVQQNAGISGTPQTATHSGISLQAREKALLSLWFTAPVE
jgi:mono/diheme cytochrome c family protein